MAGIGDGSFPKPFHKALNKNNTFYSFIIEQKCV